MFFIGGLVAAFAMLHALLYLFFPKSKGNLYYAVFAAFMAVFYVGVARSQLATEPAAVARWHTVLGTCGIAMGLAGIRFELAAFRQKVTPQLLLLTAAGVAILVRIWIRPAVYPSTWVNVWGALVCVEMLRIVAVAVSRRLPDAWMIGLGFAVMTLTGLYEILVNLGVIPWFQPLVLPFGIGVLTLSMSAYLSKQVAETNRNLAHQLEEVGRLNALNLEQERQAHEAETERLLLEAENRRHLAELEEARRLQLSMLPADRPEHPRAEIAYRMWTASEVGGDYYDYRQTGDGLLTLALGDATGHGVNSGLMVASTKSLFQSGDAGASLPETLERISRGIKSMNLRRMNVAMLLARLEGSSITLASAGMPPALVYRSGTEQVEEVLLPGPPLGTMARISYREERLSLAPGDTVLMMTDGLPEIVNAAAEDLGYERVEGHFRRVASQSPEAILGSLFEAAQEFAAGHPQEDDLTLAVIRAR